MILVDYTLKHPILHQTCNRVSDIEVRWEESHTGPDEQRQFIAWVECNNFNEFSEAIQADPTVRNPEFLTETASRRLYRFTLAGEGKDTDLMPLLMEVGGVHQELVATSEGWRNRTRFPDREAFERIHQFCRDYDIGFTFHRIWEETDRYGEQFPSLTDIQYETLIAAVESGYLEIPRECSLEELGEKLGISRTATSERFRRAVKSLIEQTIHQ